MGNIAACTRRFKVEEASLPGSSATVECVVAPAAETEPAGRKAIQERGKCKSVEPQSMMESGECTSVEQQIEDSKSHWSQVGDYCDSSDEEVAEVSNVEAFKALQMHPQWGGFFLTFGHDLGIQPSSGELVMGKKFAEGGQGELFHVHIKWWHPDMDANDEEREREWVLKVFKKGTFLRQLQAQWPHGMLQQYVERKKHYESTTEPYLRPVCDVDSGVLLKDGRFAFLMQKYQEDLRCLINRNMIMRNAQDCGPFSEDVAKSIIYNVALGMETLHGNNIVHRDLKAANVLATKCFEKSGFGYLIIDYESSIGVFGTGFFRAPEILQALKDKNISQKLELFTKESDVYSFGMFCYEILTGKLPFEDDSSIDYDHVLNGHRLELPEYVDDWAHGLLSRCWHPNPTYRPSFGDILNLIASDSIGTLVEFRKRTKLLKLSCR